MPDKLQRLRVSILWSFNLWRWDQYEFPKRQHPSTFQRRVSAQKTRWCHSCRSGRMQTRKA